MKSLVLFAFVALAVSADLQFLKQLHDEIETVLNMNDFGQSVEVEDCGGSSGSVDTVDVSPYPPSIGSTVTIKVSGPTTKAFDVTKLKATVYISGIPLTSQTIDVTQSCPKGTCTLSESLEVPSIVPAGTYQVQVQAQNGGDDNLVCGKATVTLKSTKNDLTDNVPVTDCGGSKATVASVDVTPYPPKIGSDITVDVVGQASEAFTVTKLAATIYIAGIPITTQTIPLQQSCSTGTCHITQSINVPSLVPAGTYDMKFQAQNDGEDNLACGKVTVTVQNALDDPVDFTDCGGDSAEVTAVDVSPFPPVIGKDVTLSVTGNAKTAFEITKMSATVYTAGIPISTQTIDVTDSCSGSGSCKLSATLSVPSIVPAGTYDVKVQAQNSASKNLMCGKAKITLVKQNKKFRDSVDFTDCGGSSGKITEVDVNPYPPKIGNDITLDVKGTTTKAFTVTKLKATVFVAGIPLTSQTVEVDASCPAGTCDITETLNVPSLVPAGTYTLQAQAQNDSDDNLVCAKATIQLT